MCVSGIRHESTTNAMIEKEKELRRMNSKHTNTCEWRAVLLIDEPYRAHDISMSG